MDNLIVTFLTLLVASYITKVVVKKRNLLFSAIISVIFAIFSPFLAYYTLLVVILKILVSILICVIVVNNEDIKSKFLLFYFAYITLNLICMAMLTILVKLCGGISNLYTYYLDFPISAIFLGLFVYFKILLTYFNKLKKSYEIEDYIYKVELKFRGRSLKLNAFLDSGNLLYDELYDLPIAVVPFKYAQKLLNKSEALSILLKKKSESINTMHYITYSTASNKTSKMPVFKLDKIKINGKNYARETDAMLGITFFNISNRINYDMLIGLNMIK